MDTKLPLFILSMFALLNGGCGKKCNNTNFSFKSSAIIGPVNDSINIGDTLWFGIEFPTSLVDIPTGKTVDYSNAVNLGTAVSFIKLGKGDALNPGVEEAKHLFNTKLIFGDSVPNSLKAIKEFRFKESAYQYKFRAGFVPQQQGVYMIAISDAEGVYRTNERCTKASFTLTIADTINKHLYLYEQSRPGYQISSYEATHSYCFKVR